MDYLRRTSNAISKRKEPDTEHNISSADMVFEQSSSGVDGYHAQPQRAVVDESTQEAPIQQEPIKERNIEQSSALANQDLQGGGREITPVWAKMPSKQVPPAHSVQQNRRSQQASQVQQNRKSLVDDARTLRSVHHMPSLPAAGCFDLDAPGNAPIITGYDHDYRSVTARIAENVAANHRHTLHMHQLEHAAVGGAFGGTAAGAAAYAVGGAAAGIAGGAAVGAAAGGVAAGGIMASCMDYLRRRESQKTDQERDELVGINTQTRDSKLNDQDWQKHDNASKLNALGEEGHYTVNGTQVLYSPIKDSGIRHRQSHANQGDRAVIDDEVNQHGTSSLGETQDIANGKTPSTEQSYMRGSDGSDTYNGSSIDQSNTSQEAGINSGRLDINKSLPSLDTAIGAGSGVAVGSATAGAVHRHNVSHQQQPGTNDPAYSSAIDPNAKSGQTFNDQGSSTVRSTTDDMTMKNDEGISRKDKRGVSFEDQRRSASGYDQNKSGIQDNTTPWKDTSKRQPHDRDMSNQSNPFIHDSKDYQSSLDKQNNANYGPGSFLFDESQDATHGKQQGLGASGEDKYADYQRQSSATADHKAFDDLHPASNGFNDQKHADDVDHRTRKPSKQSDIQPSLTQQSTDTKQDTDQPMMINQIKDTKEPISHQATSTYENVRFPNSDVSHTSTAGDVGGVHEPYSTPRGSKSTQSSHWGSLSGLGLGGAAAAAAAALTGSKSHSKQADSHAKQAGSYPKQTDSYPTQTESYSKQRESYPSQTRPITDDARTDQQLGTSQQPTDNYSRPRPQDFPGQQDFAQSEDTYSGQPLDRHPVRNTGPVARNTDSAGQIYDQKATSGKYATPRQSVDKHQVDSTGPEFTEKTDRTGQPLDQKPVSGKYATTDQSLDKHAPPVSKDANASGQPLDQKPVTGEYATTYERSGIGRNSMDDTRPDQPLSSTSKDDPSRFNQRNIDSQYSQPSQEYEQFIPEEPTPQAGQQTNTQQSTQQQQKIDIIDDVAHGSLRDSAAQKSDDVPATQGLQEQAEKRQSHPEPWGGIAGAALGGAAATAGATGGSKVAHMHSSGGASAQQKSADIGDQQHSDQRQSLETTDDARTGQQLGTEQRPTDDYSRQSVPSGQKSGLQSTSQYDSRQFDTSKDVGQSNYPGDNTDVLPTANVDQTDSQGNSGIHDSKIAANRRSSGHSQPFSQQEPVSAGQRRSESHAADHREQQQTSTDQSRGQRYSSSDINPVTGNKGANTQQKDVGIGAAAVAGATGGAAAGGGAASRPSQDSTHDRSTEKRALPESLEGATGGVDDDALGAMKSRKKSGKPETAEHDTDNAQYGNERRQSGVGQKVIYLDKHGKQIPEDQIRGNAIFVDQNGNRISPERVQNGPSYLDQSGQKISPEEIRRMSAPEQQVEKGDQQLLSGQQQSFSQDQRGDLNGDQGQQQSSMGGPQKQSGSQGHQGAYTTAGAVGATGGAAGAASQMKSGAGSGGGAQATGGGQSGQANLQNYADGKTEPRRTSLKESIGKMFHRNSSQKNAEVSNADAQQKFDSSNAVRRASKEGATM